MVSLTGKTAFVSGGTRGIGLAIAERLAREGADVMVAGSSQSNCDAAVKRIASNSGGRVESYAADLRTLEGCQAVFDAQSKAFNSCDILVHSAGATKGGVFPDQDDTDFIDGLQLDFVPFHLNYAFIKTFLFAMILATIPSYHGFFMKGGALEVGKASTTSFVWTSVAIIIMNSFVTNLLLT